MSDSIASRFASSWSDFRKYSASIICSHPQPNPSTAPQLHPHQHLSLCRQDSIDQKRYITSPIEYVFGDVFYAKAKGRIT